MTKNITKEEVEYTAELARLEFSDEELNKLAGNLDDILGYFKDLAEADTSKNVKINHYDLIGEEKNYFRKDSLQVVEEEVGETIKNNFPFKQNALLAVKSVLRKK
jgi:aspartyl-tRNA(Asn)/glutamyl-tRNA(Gln) amidotransferase subunit C